MSGTVSIYRNDRELLFHGNLDEAQAAGVRVSMKNRYVKLRGQELKMVNHVCYGDDQWGFWVVAPSGK